MKHLQLLGALVILGSMSVQAQEHVKDYVQLSDPVVQTEDYRVFGDRFESGESVVSLDELISADSTFNEQAITTEGVISQVCKKKGCFFILNKEGTDRHARITFKDYGFFIPTNTAGSKVKLNGIFQVKELSEEKAKHYAKDSGDDPDKIKGPQKEYSVVATSVLIYK
ncbi:DUF4920 domain-containing protein [Fodinibius salsisoli]|uniref:DUF4920 domain-containing protein n=1 Tax=Fodinibius salsisoli TaxID=2820877 RepID=A0ABT3PKQ6_9BACT|nr:DUF4920 domain-containing protein [Fodinibius salsisoli]MCW9706343.1 DUF4920 domain-containing protein [Fodinibius salsisoli]